jgi:hypothetical protein
VSVIVPARNEEACLGACLESLVSQAGVELEVLVVDDGSTDRTHEIAGSFPGVQVLEPGPLPAGWTGKNHAVSAGAQVARGAWLLFTDADTVHLPGSLARALEEAERHDVSLLSYSPEQVVKGFWEKAVLPVVFGELAATYRPAEVSDPKSPAAAANGQYLLVSRAAYQAVGGHGAVRDSLLEDVALARAVKGSGRPIRFRFGGDAVRTRMYRSFAQLSEGWTKNLALLFPSSLRLAIVRTVEFLVIAAGLPLATRLGMQGATGRAFAAAFLAVTAYLLFLRRIRKAHCSWEGEAVAILGLPVFSYLLLRSRFSHQRGRVAWKGRDYPAAAPASNR